MSCAAAMLNSLQLPLLEKLRLAAVNGTGNLGPTIK